jgi:hypothetical protein
MKKNIAAVEARPSNMRAGLISLFIFAICYLYVTGFSSVPRVLVFIVSFAVCFVLMMKSVVDLLVWAFGVAAVRSGRGLGKMVMFFRRL